MMYTLNLVYVILTPLKIMFTLIYKLIVNYRLDQPSAHIPLTPEASDPLQNVQIPCFGDLLTRVKLAGARDLDVDVTLHEIAEIDFNIFIQ